MNVLNGSHMVAYVCSDQRCSGYNEKILLLGLPCALGCVTVTGSNVHGREAAAEIVSLP